MAGYLKFQQLAIQCVKLYINDSDGSKGSKNYVCLYNPNSCSEKVYIKFEANHSLTLKSYRLLYGISVSYLIELAMFRYLDFVLDLYRDLFSGKNRLKIMKKLDKLERFFGLYKMKADKTDDGLLHLMIVMQKSLENGENSFRKDDGIP